MSEFTLTREQQQAFDLCENTSDNILIHGKPGVGKSVLIRALRETGQKHYTLAAPTGLAALNIGGKTLHSQFGIGVSNGVFAPDFNNFTTNDHVLRNVYHKVNTLIIDEISMVRADLLDYLDRELQAIKQSDLPFGGVQVIAVGDFFQLPPVTKDVERKQLKEYGYDSEFAFDAFSFKGFKVVSLENVQRQNDKEFIEFLHAARTGDITTKHLKLINRRVAPCTDFRISVTATNAQADMINNKQLSLIKEEPIKFEALQYGYWSAYPVEKVMTLKKGAQVMIKKNNADKPPYVKGGNNTASGKIVNGTICRILELPTKENNFCRVELEDGTMANIYSQRWELKEKQRNGDNKWEEKTIATFEQYPFQLAWAISIHKSQGQSFDKVHIDASRIFAAGQLYVAVSRARTLDGISLQAPIVQDSKRKMFWADKDVLRFNQSYIN